MTITGNDVLASPQLCMQVVSRDSKALAGVQAETRYEEQQMEADSQYKSGAVGINPAQQSQVSDPLPVSSVLPPHCVRTLPSFLLPHSAAGLFLGSGSSESRLTRLTPGHRPLAATPQRLKLTAGPCVCVVALITSRRRQSNLTLCLKS